MITFSSRKTAGLIAASLLCAAPGAFAQTGNALTPDHGFYLGGAAGWNIQGSDHYQIGGATSETNYGTGGAYLLDFGWAFGNGFRLEVEPGYRSNTAGTINSLAAHGETQIGSAMVNGIYDFTSVGTTSFPIVPHIGVGVGAAQVWNNTNSYPGAGAMQGSSMDVAVQGIAGVEYRFTPAWRLGLDYRYFVATDNHFAMTGAAGKADSGNMTDHSILLTVRYLFGAAPPPPPPPPAMQSLPPAPEAAAPAAQPKVYTVYFDFDRSDLTPEARQILQRAAADARGGRVTRIQVTGYTDLAGPATYNQRLSEKRAQSVKAELVHDGVTTDEIATAARGENDPAVPTPNGVREPRNRRAMIELEMPGT